MPVELKLELIELKKFIGGMASAFAITYVCEHNEECEIGISNEVD